MTTQHQLSTKTRTLHWLIALAMILLLSTGIYMVENEAYALYGLHKSLGLIIFFFALYRVFWRARRGWPEALGNPSVFMHALAKTVHYLLIIGTVLLPISGLLMSAMGGYGIPLFGLDLIAANPDPNKPGEMIPINGTIAYLAHSTHGFAGNVVILALLLHIAGAFKHHLIDKDNTLGRMLGKSR